MTLKLLTLIGKFRTRANGAHNLCFATITQLLFSHANITKNIMKSESGFSIKLLDDSKVKRRSFDALIKLMSEVSKFSTL